MSKDKRECSYCKEEIKAEATKCKHCQSFLREEELEHEGICPFCKEEIKLEATICKHCRSTLGPDRNIPMPMTRYGGFGNLGRRGGIDGPIGIDMDCYNHPQCRCDMYGDCSGVGGSIGGGGVGNFRICQDGQWMPIRWIDEDGRIHKGELCVKYPWIRNMRYRSIVR